MSKFLTRVTATKVNGNPYIRMSLPKMYEGKRLNCVAYGSTIAVEPDKDGVKVNKTETPNGSVCYSVLFSKRRLDGISKKVDGKIKTEVEADMKGAFKVDISPMVSIKTQGQDKTPAPPPAPLVCDRDNARKAIEMLNKFSYESGYEFILLGGRLAMAKRDVL